MVRCEDHLEAVSEIDGHALTRVIEYAWTASDKVCKRGGRAQIGETASEGLRYLRTKFGIRSGRVFAKGAKRLRAERYNQHR